MAETSESARLLAALVGFAIGCALVVLISVPGPLNPFGVRA
jgi:hypothetical protein